MPIKVKELMEKDRAGRPSVEGKSGKELEMCHWPLKDTSMDSQHVKTQDHNFCSFYFFSNVFQAAVRWVLLLVEMLKLFKFYCIECIKHHKLLSFAPVVYRKVFKVSTVIGRQWKLILGLDSRLSTVKIKSIYLS